MGPGGQSQRGDGGRTREVGQAGRARRRWRTRGVEARRGSKERWRAKVGQAGKSQERGGRHPGVGQAGRSQETMAGNVEWAGGQSQGDDGGHARKWARLAEMMVGARGVGQAGRSQGR